MNSKTFARLMLFLPYLPFVVSIPNTVAYLKVYKPGFQFGILEQISFSWNISAIFWFIPYTILTIGLLVWSRNKTIETMKTTYQLAPFLLIFVSYGTYFSLAVIESLVALINNTASSRYSSTIGILAGLAVASTVAAPIIGYAFIGIVFLIYYLLQKIHFIRD